MRRRTLSSNRPTPSPLRGFQTPVHRRSCSLLIPAVVLLVLAPVAIDADTAEARHRAELTRDVELRGLKERTGYRPVRIARIRTGPLDRPRLVSGVARFGYRVTSDSRAWQRVVLVGLRVVCRAPGGQRWESPFTTRNWTWIAPGPVGEGADGTAAGPDVRVKVDLLLRGNRRRPGSGATCDLLAHGGANPDAPGQPRVVVEGARRRSPTHLRLSQAQHPHAVEWRSPEAGLHLRVGETASVLGRKVELSPSVRRVRMLMGLELTTCYRGSRSCTVHAAGRHPGSTVAIYGVVRPLDTRGRPCGPARRSSARTSFVPNAVHHLKLLRTFRFRRAHRTDRCGMSHAFRVVVRVLEGNPVRVHGDRYSSAILLPDDGR